MHECTCKRGIQAACGVLQEPDEDSESESESSIIDEAGRVNIGKWMQYGCMVGFVVLELQERLRSDQHINIGKFLLAVLQLPLCGADEIQDRNSLKGDCGIACLSRNMLNVLV